MISNLDFDFAVNALQLLTCDEIQKKNKGLTGSEKIVSALKILNEAVEQGTDQQKSTLLSLRGKIKVLNGLLKNQLFCEKLCSKHQISLEEIKGMQIAIPETALEKALGKIARIFRFIVGLILDVAVLPGVAILFAIHLCKIDFNPKSVDQIKKHKVPILLLHGSNSNESLWFLGRQFLNRSEFGSVFSLNYAGFLSNGKEKGIEDYAENEIRKEIKRITELTETGEVILIGHSMGGLIAGYYAENLAVKDEINVKTVISIGSPWHGAPLLDTFCSVLKKITNNWKLSRKRLLQMSVDGSCNESPQFRQKLVSKALASEHNGVRKYYSIYSTSDMAVPDKQGCLTKVVERQRRFNFLGHVSILASPRVWLQTVSWLKEAYFIKPSQ